MVDKSTFDDISSLWHHLTREITSRVWKRVKIANNLEVAVLL
jgi:hypothetical protein